MTLQPRESRGFDDIVQTSFAAPNTAGGIEFDFSGSSGQLVVTSRLFSTQPQPTVGMFIPGLSDGEAFPTTVLTSIRNLGSGDGFRTNVGVYNREDTAASVTFTIFDGGTQVGNPVPVNVPGHSGAQVNRIFDVAGAATHATENATIVVNSNVQVFSYAAVIDNHTTDPIFVVGAQDRAAPSPTPNPTPAPTHRVYVGRHGNQFSDEVSGSNVSTVSPGTTVEWVWEGGGHTTTSGPCPSSCIADGLWNSGALSEGTFRFRFDSPGTYPYFCDPHADVMRGAVVVSPPALRRGLVRPASSGKM